MRAVVLSGDGPSFCAGLDFSSFQAMAGGEMKRRLRAVDADADAEAQRARARWRDGRITHLGQQVCWVWQELPVR